MTDPSRSDSFNTANGIYCNHCGATPAARVDFRGHRGLIFLMQFLKMPGPFCRNCGLATYRKMTADSLWQGWWGLLSFVINPITMLINLPARATVAKLPPPIPGSPYLPQSPGKPLYKRPEFAGFLIPIVAVGSLFYSAAENRSDAPASVRAVAPSTTRTPALVVPSIPPIPTLPPITTKRSGTDGAKAGDCLWNKHQPIGTDDKNPDVEIVPCTDARAQAKILGRTIGNTGESACKLQYPAFDAFYTVTYTGYMKGLSYTLCLQTL